MQKNPYDKERKFDGKIVFSDDIETGNLEIVSEIKPNEFDLYLRIDTNTHGHQNWFYFKVHNRQSS